MVIGYLEDILEGMKRGRVAMHQGDQSITFHPVDAVEMDTKAKVKEGKQRSSVEMTWRESPHVGEMAGLTGSSEESISPEMANQLHFSMRDPHALCLFMGL
jgi:amphi-Trp domain-containing protein